jgi:anaerobic magnesium-protoporphyrin IX monomethyl ester cyclase
LNNNAAPSRAADAAAEAHRSPGQRVDAVLIGYQDQGNLGMGYLAAVLRKHGRTVEMIDVRDGPERIGERLRPYPPRVVGFSLIFQFFLPQYRRVATYLRSIGIDSHFTIGGHYPSLCHGEVLTDFPEIDSVARYEGEITLLELVERLDAGGDWHEVPGLAFLRDGQVVESAPRALIPDLDELPFPYRAQETERIGGFATLPLLASRGCVRRCSFCSIHTFYRTAPGKVVRVRKPVHIVEEMLYLQREYGVRVFLFQDDDFPLWGSVGRRWANDLCKRLHESGLARTAIWKISCRAEYVEPALFAQLRAAGLFLVYMGIESGVPEGLKILHKQMTVEQNLKGVEILKELDILLSYGFMLFDPSSTFDSVRENIGFLRRIVGDGCAGAVFSRMLPYGGTPIRDLLFREGRLRGDLTRPDYDFLDLRLNEYHRLLSQAVRPWIHNNGLSYQLNYAWDELETFRRLVPEVQGYETYRGDLRALAAAANEQLFRIVEESSASFENGNRDCLDPAAISESCGHLIRRLESTRNRFVADNVELLAAAARMSCVDGPVMVPQVH